MFMENGRAIAAYIRVSSDKQDTERQEIRIRATNLPIAFWFRDNVGKNPRDLPHKRPDFQRMLQAVEAGLIDTIVVDRQDRFGVANAHQWGKYISLLRDNETSLIDADGKVLSAEDDSTVLIGTIGALTSRREQKEKAHRNITAKLNKAKEGEYQGGYPPYGFDVVCFDAGGVEKWRTVYVGKFKRFKVYPDGKREQFDGKGNSPRKDPTDKFFIRPSIETDRIDIVKQIFTWYAKEDISPRQIATRLNNLGVDAIYGNGWDKVRIQGILNNPAYVGFPTWNKNGSSRFAEYVDGHILEVQNKKTGRKRAKSDYVKPTQPLYKHLIPQNTWEKVQHKLHRASEECRAIPRCPANTAELYLKPFLVCAHCGKHMHATMGRSTAYLWPSYFCSTYNKYGPSNPTGCHCHRVRHLVLEKIVKAYLKETQPKIIQLLEAADTGNLEAAKPLLDSLDEVAKSFGDATTDLLHFIWKIGDGDEEVSRLIKKRKGWDKIYGVLYERFRPDWEAKIKEKETALDTLLDEYVGLPTKIKERMNKRMEALQDEIDTLKDRLIDLRKPWGNLREELAARQKAVDHAIKVIGKNKDGREKTEALKSVISEIRCTFRHTATKDTKHNGKSFLDTVEIASVSGKKWTYIDGSMPGQG